MALLLNYINAVLYPSVSTCKCVWVWKINTHFLCIILLGGLHIPLIDTSFETRCLSQSHSTLQNNLWSLNLLPIKPTSTGHTRTLLQVNSWTFLHSVWVIFIKHPTHSGWKLFLIRSLSSNIFPILMKWLVLLLPTEDLLLEMINLVFHASEFTY